MIAGRRGKFIVFEGTDGSGKGTQTNALVRHCADTNQRCEVLDFPRYNMEPWGPVIGQYLNGNFGSLQEVHPTLAALPYMLDRILAAPHINEFLESGGLVIANRYAESNLAFQAAKLPKERRQMFIQWLRHVEHVVHGVPRADLVVLLKVTPDLGQRNVDIKGEREYTRGRDIHEANLDYQREVADVYLEMAANENHWRVIDCMDGYQMKPKEEINRMLIDVLVSEGILSQ